MSLWVSSQCAFRCWLIARLVGIRTISRTLSRLSSPAGAIWRYYDRVGFLDLVVSGYAKFDPDNPPLAGKGGVPPGFCQFRAVTVMCGPRGLPGESDHLFHNNGNGTFTDVSVKAGVSDPRGYYALAPVFVDVDNDGWLDCWSPTTPC